MKVGDFVVERLHAWGVRRIYGYPGDGINGVIGALQRADKIEFIQVRHEEMAAFMAVAHATPIPAESQQVERRTITPVGGRSSRAFRPVRGRDVPFVPVGGPLPEKQTFTETFGMSQKSQLRPMHLSKQPLTRIFSSAEESAFLGKPLQ